MWKLPSAAKKVVALHKMQLNTVTAEVQQAYAEMKICTLGHNSILRSLNRTLKQFSLVGYGKKFEEMCLCL